MKLWRANRAQQAQLLLVVSVLGLAAQIALTWRQRVDVAAAERYGRGLRSAFALELALTAEVMRAQSGLVGHYDGLVDIEQRLKAQLAALSAPPAFLADNARDELKRSIGIAEEARRKTEERVDQFKSEHAVLRNSLRFLPVASRALDAYAASTEAEQSFKDGASALVRDVLLLQSANDRAQLERIARRLAALSLPTDGAGAPELGLVLVHARIAMQRAPRIAELVRGIVQRPEVSAAEDLVARYETFLTRARRTADYNSEVSFALLLLVVLASALAIIVRLRESESALRATAGELERAVASLRVEQEKQRELAELKSRFVSMTSHEFRTPLSTIMSSSELLEAYAERWPSAKKQEHFGRIQSAVRSMMRMLDGVLMVGRSDAGRLELKPGRLELRRFCEEAVETALHACRGDHAIALETQIDEPAVVDEALLRHVIDNLLSNAIKYSPRGSQVSLRARRERDELVFEVTDHGIGIPLADQQRLFETFERGSNVGAIPGTGLGLGIAKRAVDLHGGTLSVTSAVGAGTCFTVRLPFIRDHERGAA